MTPCVVMHSDYYVAHRYVRAKWVERFGPLDRADFLCHLCPEGRCVNLQHVYPGDAASNMKDTLRMGRHASLLITHCPNGHEYTDENTMKRPSDRGRRCRECMKVKNREDARKHRARK